MGIRNIIIHALGGYTAEEWQAQLAQDRGAREYAARGMGRQRPLILKCWRRVNPSVSREVYKEAIALVLGDIALERGAITFRKVGEGLEGEMIVFPKGE